MTPNINENYGFILYKILSDGKYEIKEIDTDLPTHLIIQCQEWFTIQEGHYYYNKKEMTQEEALSFVKSNIIRCIQNEIHELYKKEAYVSMTQLIT